jgi:hypothetical protein
MHPALLVTKHSASLRLAQAEYIAAMEDRPYRLHRRARLQQLLDRFGGPKSLQQISGVTDTHLTACAKGRRGIGDDMACSLETAAKAPFGWMDTDPALDSGAPEDEAHLLAVYRRLNPPDKRRALAVMAAAFPGALLQPGPAGDEPTPSLQQDQAPPSAARRGALQP